MNYSLYSQALFKFASCLYIAKKFIEKNNTNSLVCGFVLFTIDGSMSGEKKTAQCAVFPRADSNHNSCDKQKQAKYKEAIEKEHLSCVPFLL